MATETWWIMALPSVEKGRLRSTKLSQWGLSHEFQLELIRQFKVDTWITQITKWPLRHQHQKHQDTARNKKQVQADLSWGSSSKVKFCSTFIGNLFLWMLMITFSLPWGGFLLGIKSLLFLQFCKLSILKCTLKTWAQFFPKPPSPMVAQTVCTKKDKPLPLQ